MGYRKGYYKKDGTYVQGHFVNKSSKKKKRPKAKNGCLGLLIVAGMLLTAISCENNSDCDSNCSDFATQQEAQSTFEAIGAAIQI